MWRRGLALTVVLAGPEMPTFRRFIGQFGAAAQIRRLGVLNDAQKRDFFAGIDLFARPNDVPAVRQLFYWLFEQLAPNLGFQQARERSAAVSFFPTLGLLRRVRAHDRGPSRQTQSPSGSGFFAARRACLQASRGSELPIDLQSRVFDAKHEQPVPRSPCAANRSTQHPRTRHAINWISIPT